jgi:hypothetical protein
MKDTIAAPAPKGFRVSARNERRQQRDLLVPSVQQLLHNEQVSHRKILACEERWKSHDAMTFWQRLRWIIRG